MNIEKGYLICIDIVGYKNVIYSNDNIEIEKLRTAVNKILNVSNLKFRSFQFLKNYKQLMVRCFSDNVLIFYPSQSVEKDELLAVSSFAAEIQQLLLLHFFMSKGSICFGDFEYNNDVVFGRLVVDGHILCDNQKEPTINLANNLKCIYEKEIGTLSIFNPIAFWQKSDAYAQSDYINVFKTLIKRLNNSPDELNEKIYIKLNGLLNNLMVILNQKII